MKNEDRTHLLGIIEKTLNSIITKNKVSIEDACKLIRWLDKADSAIDIYTRRMQEILREWCLGRMLEEAVAISDNEKSYFVLLEQDFIKNVKDF